MSDATTTDPLQLAKDIVRREGNAVVAVADQLDESFLTVLNLVQQCAGKVFITGAGTSGAIARRMAHLMSVCGTPSVFLNGMDALHGTMGAVINGDLLITISRGGESEELNELARRIQTRGVPVVAVTAAPTSTLGKLADVIALVDAGPEADPGGLIAMGSTLAAAAWGDALATLLMQVKGYGWDEFLFTHPAGSVGQVEDLPQVPPTEVTQRAGG